MQLPKMYYCHYPPISQALGSIATLLHKVQISLSLINFCLWWVRFQSHPALQMSLITIISGFST